MSLIDAIFAIALGINLGVVGLLVAFFVLSQVWRAVDRGYRHFYPPPGPHCDIDPRNHPAFARGADGKTYIGSVHVQG